MNRLVRTICMYVCVCVCVCVLSHVQLFATLWIIAHQAPLSMGFSRQEYWSRLPFPSTGDLLHPGIKPVSPASPALQADSLSLKPLGHLVRKISSVQFSRSVVSTLWDHMNRSTPGLPVHHQLLEFTQTHVHRVSDAIQPSVVPFSSCPQSLPASESFPMSQLFAGGGQSTGVSA